MGIVTAMIKIVAAILVGYFLNKAKILNEDINRVMSKIIIYAAGPCTIFASVLSLEAEKKGEILYLMLAGVGLYVFMFILAFLESKILRPEKRLSGVYQIALIFGNAAFLGFPIGEALMGNVGISYMAILNIHNNVFVYSYGVFLLTRNNEGKFKFSPKELLNPGIISAIVALILFYLNVQLPDLIMEPVNFMGQLTSPIAMLIIGSMIATYPLKMLFNNWRHYVIALFRLVINPIIVYLLCLLIFGSGDIAKVVTLHASMPMAIILTMLALIYDADSKTTSQITGLMNILCIATIPCMWIFMNWIG